MVSFIDSHCHLTDSSLLPQLDLILNRAQKASVDKIINVCTDEITLQKGLEAQKKYKNPRLYLAAATTPHDVDRQSAFFETVKQAAQNQQLIAIGETGLDYHYLHSSKENQKKELKKYLQLARETSLPLIFHVRKAFADFFDLLPPNVKGVMHCFTGSLKEAKTGLNKGLFISFSGIVTFAKSLELKDVVKNVPLDRILIETDAPYLAPESRRGQKNEPAFVVETAAEIARLKGISLEDVAAASYANAQTLFNLD